MRALALLVLSGGPLGCTDARSLGDKGGLPEETAASEDTAEDTAPEDSTETPDPVYDPSVLHEVVITLDDADWETLRNQSRSIYEMLEGDCLSAPWEAPYTYFEADVVFDGADLGTVGLRKKGLMGSASTTRPSLRIDADRYVDGGRFDGLEKLVLNNNNQDESRIRSCLAHGFYADAGLVAPRCSLAHVVVNGDDLGIYDNAEALDSDLVKRVRGAKPATLYEGRLSDFREGWLGSFEGKTDESDGADLLAVQQALEASDAELLDALEPVLDVDDFLRFWAAEAISGHWDGYNGNTNNFYVYGDADDGRLHFFAGGPDAAFDSREPFGSGAPIWAPTASVLANRLIQIPAAKARYEAMVQTLLDDSWDVDARLAQIDAWRDLLADDTNRSERQDAKSLRAIVAARADDIEAALGEDVTPDALREIPCFVDVGDVTVSFSTTFGSYPNGDLYSGGEATTSYEISGVTYTSVQDGVTVGWSDRDHVLFLTISQISENTYLAPYVLFDAGLLADGTDIPIDGYVGQAYLLYNGPDTGGQWTTAAYLGDGYFSLDVASDADDATVSGALSLNVLASGG